jgi:hypothetical protein
MEWKYRRITVLKESGVEVIGKLPLPRPERQGVTGNGYVSIYLSEPNDEDRAVLVRLGYNPLSRSFTVPEHRFIAAKFLEDFDLSLVVRHLNGRKYDNRLSNLVMGTIAENNMDHETARIMAMYWHNRHNDAQREIATLRAKLAQRFNIPTIQPEGMAAD